MKTRPAAPPTLVTRQHFYLLVAASVMTYLLITMGGVVCVTESGRGCPDWPGCYGQALPPMQTSAVIEYLHRLLAALTSPFIILAAIVGWTQSRSIAWVSRPPAIAIVFLIAVIIFGAMAIITGIPPAVAAVDLGSALFVLALLLTASVAALLRREQADSPDTPTFESPFARLTLAALAGVFLVLVSSVLVAESGSPARCLGWPVYSHRPDVASLASWPQLARLLIGGVTTLLVLGVVVQAWRTQRSRSLVVKAASLVGLFLLIEIVIGVLPATGDLATVLRVIYAASAAALWAMLVVLVVLAGFLSSQSKIPSSGKLERPIPLPSG